MHKKHRGASCKKDGIVKEQQLTPLSDSFHLKKCELEDESLLVLGSVDL